MKGRAHFWWWWLIAATVGVAMLLPVVGPLRRASFQAWLTLAVSLTAWFVPDTALSLWLGFWRNALLNLVFLVLFALPLAAMRRACLETRGADPLGAG